MSLRYNPKILSLDLTRVITNWVILDAPYNNDEDDDNNDNPLSLPSEAATLSNLVYQSITLPLMLLLLFPLLLFTSTPPPLCPPFQSVLVAICSVAQLSHAAFNMTPPLTVAQRQFFNNCILFPFLLPLAASAAGSTTADAADVAIGTDTLDYRRCKHHDHPSIHLLALE